MPKAKPIRWLTQVAIIKASEKSSQAALECSVKHWEQLVAANRTQLKEAENHAKTSVFSGFCALCQRYVDCKCEKCPVCLAGAKCKYSHGPWGDAARAYDGWMNAEGTSGGLSAFAEWRHWAKKMLAFLRSLKPNTEDGINADNAT